MSLTEVIIVEFINHYLGRQNGRDDSKKNMPQNGRNGEIKLTVKTSKYTRQKSQKILASLKEVAKEFDEFLQLTFGLPEHFAELNYSLIPLLLYDHHEPEGKFSEAFKAIGDELFSQGITWARILIFMVYAADLSVQTNREVNLYGDGESSLTKILQIVENVTRYFDDHLVKWIDQQEGGWMDIIRYEKQDSDELDHILEMYQPAPKKKASKGNERNYMRQVMGMAAIAAVIGGLYMCSRLTVQ